MLRIKEIKLLNGKTVSLEVNGGEVLEIAGANGTGKSLLLKTIARLIPSKWTEMSLNEKDTRSYSIEDWRANILYLPPEVIFDPEMTVQNFFELPLHFEHYKNFKKTFFPEDHWVDSSLKMSSLSSGQKQQVALLRVLSLSPQILLLDEPFGHMDSFKREEFTQLLNNWCSADRGIILISHIPVKFESVKLKMLSLS